MMIGRPAKYPSDPNGDSKRCTKCGEVRLLDGFYADKGGILGRVSACKECCKGAARAYGQRVSAAYQGPPPEKECFACKVVKPACEFAPNRRARSGLQSHCKPCRNKKGRWWALKAAYGLTRGEYEAMCDAQGGRCAICLEVQESTPRGVLFVDHCHASGNVRGLLCESCNLAIGKLKDSPEVLRRAADYLEKSR